MGLRFRKDWAEMGLNWDFGWGLAGCALLVAALILAMVWRSPEFRAGFDKGREKGLEKGLEKSAGWQDEEGRRWDPSKGWENRWDQEENKSVDSEDGE